MTFDPVPWFVGGGAQHSPEVARLLAYAASAGAEGIIDPLDLRVSALDTATSKVRIGPGSGLALNRAAGGSQQTYAFRNAADELIDIPATAAGGGRSDLIIARVEDPFAPGEPWSDPTDPTAGPYIFGRRISNVSATATTVPAGTSGIALARIDIPAGTTAITNSMVKDLRQISNPRRQRSLNVFSPTASELTPGRTAGRQRFTTLNESVYCPAWATRAQIVVTMSGEWMQLGNYFGSMRAEYGHTGSTSTAFVATQDAGLHHDESSSVGQRITTLMASDVAIPADFRGKSHFVRLSAITNSNSATNARGVADTYTTVSVDVEFLQVAE